MLKLVIYGAVFLIRKTTSQIHSAHSHKPSAWHSFVNFYHIIMMVQVLVKCNKQTKKCGNLSSHKLHYSPTVLLHLGIFGKYHAGISERGAADL